jgi:putative hydrolase of the HAD superfamily
MSAKKHLFFDLDRTLWDFEKNSKKALQILFKDLKLDDKIEHFNHFHHTYTRINAELWKLYGKGKLKKEELRDARFIETLKYHEILDTELATTLSNGYIEISPKQTNLFPETLETLEELKRMKYNMHIITNGFEEVQYIKLEHSKLAPFFDVIVCSEAVGFNKPDPRVFQYAMQKAQTTASQSFMIGDDREVDIFGAIQVGMQAILFDPENQYSKTNGEPKIQNLNELPLLLAMIGK